MTTISISFPKVGSQAYLLCAMRILWIAMPLAILLPLHLIWLLLKLPSPWAMLFLHICARALGARVTVYGKPLRRDVFFVANHISWHDIPILAGITGSAFVAQDGVRDWPVVGWLAKLNRTIFISHTFSRRHYIRWPRITAVQTVAVWDACAPTQTDDDSACLFGFWH
jgi:lyso-ornithine lipid O-acyltransferase